MEPDQTSDPDTTADATQAADERDATAAHRADRQPTPEEEAAAEKNDLDPKTAEAYQEMSKLGAQVEGEGKI